MRITQIPSITTITYIIPLLSLIHTFNIKQPTHLHIHSTNPHTSTKLHPQPPLHFRPLSLLSTEPTTPTTPIITVDQTKKYQRVEGFGYALTGGSAMLINQMNQTERDGLLREVFASGDAGGLGVGYLRLTIGASDLDAYVYSYNDLPVGQTDVNLTKFNISHQRLHRIPIMKKIYEINPKIKTIASPWSAPVWMKDNGKTIGGNLKPQYYSSYAKYFVKYVQAMAAQGITIDAITPQNQPLYGGNNPSMHVTAQQQRDFIKYHLGPAFAAANLTTKIIVYDHNLNRPDYPATIYKDPEAAKYVDGAGFHLYAGNTSAMGQLHDSFPTKNLYFTEMWTGSNGKFEQQMIWHTKNVIIGTMRHWSIVTLQWNLANDPTYHPHTPGGCDNCKGALTISGSSYTRNVAYYIIGHASKFVPPGSIRIESNLAYPIQNVAFLRPDGKKVMVVLNEGDRDCSFQLRYRGEFVPVRVMAGEVITVVW